MPTTFEPTIFCLPLLTKPLSLFADEASFFGLVSPYVQGLKPPVNAPLQAVPTALVQFTPIGVHWANILARLGPLTWKKLTAPGVEPGRTSTDKTVATEPESLPIIRMHVRKYTCPSVNPVTSIPLVG